jgi:hypothetical protein
MENEQQLQTQNFSKVAQIILPLYSFVVTSDLTAIISVTDAYIQDLNRYSLQVTVLCTS